MTGYPLQAAFLRQIDPPPGQNPIYALSDLSDLAIGRDPSCQIIFDSARYGGISRRHAEVCQSPESPSGWQICDLNSANGTFVNGWRVQGCQVLNAGDRIALGQGEPQLVFELQPISPAPQSPFLQSPVPQTPAPQSNSKPPAARSSASASSGTAYSPAAYPPVVPPDGVTLSQLFPILSTGRDLTRKAYLVPGGLTVSFVILLFVAVGNAVFFNLLLAAYLSGAAYYVIYQLCGKHKPLWLLIGAGVMTMLVLVSPLLNLFIFVFRVILPGGVPNHPQSSNFAILLIQMFFGAGLMEELIKALPIFLVYWIGTGLRSPRRERLGVWEPLDGILLGTASAVGFTLLETLGQYVPGIINDVSLQAGQGARELLGLQLLIPRILGSVSGHMAYSGYFGYFIGLSVLKPAKRWQILAIGYLSAASLHALWNASGAFNLLVLAIVGVSSYAFLAAAILKARALSPTRAQNFATRLTGLH
jgi:RsiW-degrading membrane proteinase PrsW (M82 family)